MIPLRRERRLHDRVLAHRVVIELGDDSSAAHDEHAMSEPEHLLVLGRDEHYCHALLRERVDELVDRALGADVDSASRLVGDQHAGTTEEPLAEQHLLLVAARERSDTDTGSLRADVEAPNQVGRRPPLTPPVDDSRTRDRLQVRQRDVVRDRAEHQEPLSLAVLRHHRDSGSNGTARRADADRATRQGDLARVGPVGAEDRPHELRATAPDQAGEPDDLAGTNVERGVDDRGRAREAAHREDNRRVVGRKGLVGERQLHRPPEHGVDERVGCLVGGRGSPHEPAVSQDGHVIGECEHLGEEVRDVDDRRPPVAEAAGSLEQTRALVGGERRRGLVHHDQPRIPGDRAHDLGLLLVGDPKRAGGSIRRQVEAHLVDQRVPPST